jgi:hypothetical protein
MADLTTNTKDLEWYQAGCLTVARETISVQRIATGFLPEGASMCVKAAAF